MNLFLLAPTPRQCAECHCDKHVGKMLVESVQIVYAALAARGWDSASFAVQLPDGSVAKPYRTTHKHHPCVLWAGSSRQHLRWILELARSLAAEWERRRLGVRPETQRHRCVHHVAALAALLSADDAWPREMPVECTVDEWLEHLRLRDEGGDKLVDIVAPRLHTRDVPAGLAFAVAAIDACIDDQVAADAGAIERYRAFYATKQLQFDMQWSRAPAPPDALSCVLARVTKRARAG
jgi:hypothetical protein